MVSKTMQRIVWGGATLGLLLTMVICGMAFGKGGFSGGSHVSAPAPRPAPAAPAPRPAPPRPVISRPRPGTRPILRRPLRRPIQRRRIVRRPIHAIRPVYGPNGQPASYNPGHSHNRIKTILIILGVIVLLLLVIGAVIMASGYNTVKKRMG